MDPIAASVRACWDAHGNSDASLVDVLQRVDQHAAARVAELTIRHGKRRGSSRPTSGHELLIAEILEDWGWQVHLSNETHAL